MRANNPPHSFAQLAAHRNAPRAALWNNCRDRGLDHRLARAAGWKCITALCGRQFDCEDFDGGDCGGEMSFIGVERAAVFVNHTRLAAALNFRPNYGYCDMSPYAVHALYQIAARPSNFRPIWSVCFFFFLSSLWPGGLLM